jgi:hypothetical protein
MIGSLDLLTDRPERRVGRGLPRVLRHASAAVLVALLGAVAASATAAVRAPTWTDDTAEGRTDLALDDGSDPMTLRGLRHGQLLRLLHDLEGSDGVELLHVDVRSDDVSTDGRRPVGWSDVHVRISLGSADGGGLRRVLDRLDRPELRALEVTDHTLTPTGAVASLALQVRSDTARLSSAALDDDPATVIPDLVARSGAELVSLRFPGTDASGQRAVLSAVGPLASIASILEELESTVSSTGRIATLTLRRHDDGRGVLDVALSLRDRLVSADIAPRS